jgi:hypothetical protein
MEFRKRSSMADQDSQHSHDRRNTHRTGKAGQAEWDMQYETDRTDQDRQNKKGRIG